MQRVKIGGLSGFLVFHGRRVTPDAARTDTVGYRMTGLTKGGNKLLERSSQVLGAKAAPKGGENVRPEFSKN
jgi:hypothetical protein